MSKAGLTGLREQLSPRWTDERAGRVRAALDARGRRRATLRRAALVGASLAAVAGAMVVLHARLFPLRPPAVASLPAAPPEAASAAPTAAVTTVLGPDSDLVADPEGEGRSFSLRKGGARFVVPHDAVHPLRVRVGSAVVEDVGTVFTVRRLTDTAAEVEVDEGRVRVTSRGGSFEVAASERRTFEIDVPDAGTREPHAPEAPAHAAPPAWRPLAESGRYGEAYESLKGATRTVRDEAGDLLLAADVARLSGHPADAVPFLERVLRSQPNDPRAGLAAFTLGRVLLDELGRPGEAATAFARAAKAGGPLAEDALAREVEASSRAGDTTRARTLALEYERLYPGGRRSRVVAKFGGLE
jgi:transmembrane sensor